MDIGYDGSLPRSTRSAVLLFSYQTSLPYLQTNCQILPTTGQYFLLPRLYKILLKIMCISNEGKKNYLKHFLRPLRSYRTGSISFSEKIGKLTGKVKSTKRQKDSRVCNKYLLSAWQNSQTWVRQVRWTSNETRKLSGNFIYFTKETSHSLQDLSDLVFKYLGST